MKAIVTTKYGPPDVLRLEEVEKPIPREGEVLVKVCAASANILDLGRMRGPLAVRLLGGGLRSPKFKVLGADIAGRVEEVGRDVKQFKPGDEVFGDISAGGFAEHACAAENKLAPKPGNVSFEAAAAVPVAGLTALQGLRDAGRIRSGQKVLINGASGGVGMLAVQIARSFGAEVTAVCSPRNLEAARSMGADHVIDYTQEDFTQFGRQYDLILAVNGYHPIAAYRRALAPQGVYVAAGGSLAQVIQSLLLGRLNSKAGGQRMGFMGIARIDQGDLVFLKELLEAGKVVPLIDRRYPLSETAEALRYLGEGHARGKVVITVGNGDKA
jgi:NADPH:quinone reductase-like Zn-dependent oxidoreductase